MYVLLRYVVRTPFGLTLQGIRDDPVRMRSLGYNVALHRTLAFAFAGFIAAIGGILFVWWNAQIAPSTIGLGATIDVLVIAVIGGMFRLEGAWFGALVFVVINNYAPDIGFVSDRFHTLIGVIFLVIVLVSPDGLMGLWERATSRTRRGPAAGETSGGGGYGRPVPAGGRGHRRSPVRRATPPRTNVTAEEEETGMSAVEGAGAGRSGRRSAWGSWRLAVAGCGASDNIELGARAARPPSRRASAPASSAATAPDGLRRPSSSRRAARARRSRSRSSPSARARSASFDKQNMAGAVAAIAQFAGAKPKNPSKPREGWTGGAISGHPLKLVGVGCGDDTADTAIKETRRLMEQLDADVMIGPLSGDESIAVANYAKQHPDKTFVNGAAGAQDTTLKVRAPNFFRFNGDGAQWNAGLGDLAYNKLGWRKAAVIGDDYSFGWTSMAGFIAEFCAVGGQVTKRVFPPLNTTDYSSYAQQLPTDVDGTFVAVGGAGLIPFLKAYEQSKGPIDAKKFLGNVFWGTPSQFEQLGPRVAGAYAGGAGTAGDLDTPEAQYYANNIIGKWFNDDPARGRLRRRRRRASSPTATS